MPIRSRGRKTIQEFVDALDPGTRVIWIANGAAGIVLPDKTIRWDDGHHMTRKDMRDHHALLIHSEAERKRLHEALDSRLKCLKSGCQLIHWDDEGYDDDHPERLCPVAVLTVAKSPSKARSKDARRNTPAQPPQPSAA
jgi:hypothetical protein